MTRIQSNNSQLFTSIIFGILTLLIASQTLSQYIIQPLAYDASLARSGRYSFSFEAWETIGLDENRAVVGIGTSLTQYAISGSCVENNINQNNTHVYNLGVPGSLPYIEMMQTTTAINHNPSLILLELNPINLYPLEYASSEYIEMRIKLNSLFMDSNDYGDWVELLREQDKENLDGILRNPFASESTYFNTALEQELGSFLMNETAPRHWYLSTPSPQSTDWTNYLRNPVWLPRYLDSLNESELIEYESETIAKEIKRPRYNPLIETNANYEALVYMVSAFSSNEIPVILVSYPIHPNAKSLLLDGQFDAHNMTIEKLTEFERVSSLNLIWEDSWTPSDFYDIEHLDVLGREKICSKLAFEINQTLS